MTAILGDGAPRRGDLPRGETPPCDRYARSAHAGGPEPSDEELVRIAQTAPNTVQGRRATSDLFRRYEGRLYSWCYLQVRDRERALDLMQESCLAALRALPRFEGRSRFSSWLFAIARYQFLGSLRAAKLPIDPEVEMDQLPAATASIEDDYIRRERQARLLALVERTLEPCELLALWLRCMDSMSVAEITRKLGLDSKSGARGLLQTARRKLRVECAMW